MLRTKKKLKALLGILVSLLGLIWIGMTVGFAGLASAFSQPIHFWFLLPFGIVTILILILYGIRWRQLLDGRIKLKEAIVSGMLCLGGNMFLPVRGGEILRLHYTHSMAAIPVAKLFSRLFVEKVIDLFSIAFIGLLAALFLRGTTLMSGAGELMFGTGVTLLFVLGVILVLKYCQTPLLGVIRPIFIRLKKEVMFERHVVRLIADSSLAFSPPFLAPPTVLTIFLWLTLYAAAYFFGGQLVGVNLSYPEALIVMFAGALGLMVPAAPSGVGTFHASVASSFLLLGRSLAEGLLLATVLHLLFFITIGLPALSIYGYWHFKRHRTHSTEKHA